MIDINKILLLTLITYRLKIDVFNNCGYGSGILKNCLYILDAFLYLRFYLVYVFNILDDLTTAAASK